MKREAGESLFSSVLFAVGFEKMLGETPFCVCACVCDSLDDTCRAGLEGLRVWCCSTVEGFAEPLGLLLVPPPFFH